MSAYVINVDAKTFARPERRRPLYVDGTAAPVAA